MFADRIIFVCIILLAAVYFYATAQIPTLEIGDPLGPKAFPRLLGVGLLITAALLFIEMFRARKAQEREIVKKTVDNRRHFLVVAAVTVWTAIYFAGFEPLGFVIATSVYLVVLTAYFNRGKWIANVITSIVFSVASYSMFKLLGVTLPKGVLFF